MSKVDITWLRQRGMQLTAIYTSDLTDEQLRHYAKASGFIGFAPVGRTNPVYVSGIEQAKVFISVLEAAGYEIGEQEIEVIDDL